MSAHTQDAPEVPCSLFSGTRLQAVRCMGSAGSRKVAAIPDCAEASFAPTVVFCVLISQLEWILNSVCFLLRAR